MRVQFFPVFADILRATPTVLAQELHSVATAPEGEHEFHTERSRAAYAELLTALGTFMHASSFERAVRDVAGENFRALPARAVCCRCGSEDVVRDASARWDDEAGEWTLSGVDDDQTCQGCGAEGSSVVEYKPIAPENGSRVRIKPRERIGGDPAAGRTGEVVRPNHVCSGLYVRLDPQPLERIEKIELVELQHLEVGAAPAIHA